MEPCYYSRKNRMTVNCGCVVLVIFAIYIAGVDIYFILNSSQKDIAFWDLGYWLLSLLLIKASCFYYLVFSSRSYKFTKEGILIRNIRKKILRYSWDEISEVSVCDVHHASKSLYHEKVIRVVIGNEENGPSNPKCSRNLLNGRERWRNASYGLRHYKKVILIEYNEERLNHIQTVSKKEIKDYRTKAWKD